MRKDGTRFWESGEMTPLKSDDDEPVGFLKIVRDRTEHRRTEIAIRASETRTCLEVDATNLGIWEATSIFRAVHLDERRRDILRNIDHDVPEYETAPLGRMVKESQPPVARSCRDRHG
jgi:PAS domain-containing protein